MSRIIAVVNHKGGVGKTTTTLNLGKALSLQGKKVLLIDIDPQANLSQSVGIDDPERSLYDTFVKEVDLMPYAISENLEIVATNLELASAEMQLQAEHITGYFKLKTALSTISHQYDFVLIDCPPSLGILTINALLASNEVLVVTEAQYLAIKGLQTILNLIEKLRKSLVPQLKIRGFLFTMFNRTVVSKSIIEQIRQQYGNLVFETLIRQNVRISEASALKKDIFSYDAQSAGAEDYLNLSKELIYG